jgi:hypothetical protein
MGTTSWRNTWGRLYTSRKHAESALTFPSRWELYSALKPTQLTGRPAVQIDAATKAAPDDAQHPLKPRGGPPGFSRLSPYRLVTLRCQPAHVSASVGICEGYGLGLGLGRTVVLPGLYWS